MFLICLPLFFPESHADPNSATHTVPIILTVGSQTKAFSSGSVNGGGRSRNLIFSERLNGRSSELLLISY